MKVSFPATAILLSNAIYAQQVTMSVYDAAVRQANKRKRSDDEEDVDDDEEDDDAEDDFDDEDE